jgi:hypothetical protein
MLKPGLIAALAAAALVLSAGTGRAADDIVLVCASAPAHPDCGNTEHFKVDAEAEGKAAFARMRERLYDAADPVARTLALSKWGNPTGFQDLITEAFFYPVDKAKCIYAEAERVFYGEESGPIEEGTNENTARAVILYLNNINPRALAFRDQGVFHGNDRLLLSKSGVDAEKFKKDWEAIYARQCKGK